MRYIPEILVRGCYSGCPYYEYMDHADYCNKKRNWVRIEIDDNIARNDKIHPECPLPIK